MTIALFITVWCMLAMIITTSYIVVTQLCQEITREREAHAATTRKLDTATDQLLSRAGSLPLSLPAPEEFTVPPPVWQNRCPVPPTPPAYGAK